MQTELEKTRAETSPVALSVYRYQDYRRYLCDLIDLRKSRQPAYSRKIFARAIGFSSDAGLNMVLSGKRELRSPYLDRCIDNLNLPLNERLYFEAMVRAGGLTPAKRSSLLKEVELLAGTWEAPQMEAGIRIIDFYIVQQILCLFNVHVAADQIKALFRYEIPLAEVERILLWMLDRGYVDCKNHSYKILKSVFMTKDEYPNTSFRKAHVDAMALAAQALNSDAVADREFQTYFFTVKQKNFQDIKERIKRLTREIISEFESDRGADSVVQMHFNLFEVIDRSKLPKTRFDDDHN